MVQLLLSNCAIQIRDHQFCSPIPVITQADGTKIYLGATCDNFLSEHQLILSQDDWEKLQADWLEQGMSTECTSSDTLGDIKAELEKLCSRTRCSYQTIQAIHSLRKVISLGDTSKQIRSQQIKETFQ